MGVVEEESRIFVCQQTALPVLILPSSTVGKHMGGAVCFLEQAEMTVEIPLTRGYTAIVDDEDADLAQFKWQANARDTQNSVYAERRTKKNGKYTSHSIHRTILSRMLGRSLLSTEEVDHINLNGCDNRRENLRLATHQQNQSNKVMYKNNKSGYKGVFKLKTTKSDRWMAGISVNGKRVHLGNFGSPEEAAEAYRIAAEKYRGEFARS